MRPRRPSRFLGLALLAGGIAASGCADDERPAEWPYISAVIFQPTCATQSCHSRAAAVAGLDFSDEERGWKSLTSLWVWVTSPSATDLMTLPCGPAPNGQTVCEQHFRPLVTPYDPNQSRLVHMLRARGADRMPPDRPLNEPDIRLVEQWILNGAERRPTHAGPGPGSLVDAEAAPNGVDAGASRDGGVD